MISLKNVRWIKLDTHLDDRGSLTSIESEMSIPFKIQRIFYMHQIVSGADRGGHAHMDTDQCAIAVHGSVKVKVSDGLCTNVYKLNSPSWGIFLPRLTWTDLYDFSNDAVCIVLANTHYDRSKSLRSWSEYLQYRDLDRNTVIPVYDSELYHP